jgi:parvulin-like peptidyl-prolyl isomerase
LRENILLEVPDLKRFFLYGAALILSLSLWTGCGSSEKVAVRVNKDSITEAEFINRVKEVDAVSLAESAQRGGPARAGEFAMQSIIRDRLILQAAAEKQVVPSEAQITSYIAYAKKYPAYPGAIGSSPFRSEEEWKRLARLQLAFHYLMFNPLNIQQDELNKTYEELKPVLMQPDQYRLRVVDVSSEAKAKEALDALNKGVPFETVALTKSEDRDSASKSGDIGFIPDIPGMPEPILQAARKLKPNEYTKQIVRAVVPARGAGGQPGAPTETRYFLIQLIEKKTGTLPPMEEVRFFVETSAVQKKDPNALQRAQAIVREFTAKSDIQINIKGYEQLGEQLKAAASGQLVPSAPLPGAPQPAPSAPPAPAPPAGTTPGTAPAPR